MKFTETHLREALRYAEEEGAVGSVTDEGGVVTLAFVDLDGLANCINDVMPPPQDSGKSGWTMAQEARDRAAARATPEMQAVLAPRNRWHEFWHRLDAFLAKPWGVVVLVLALFVLMHLVELGTALLWSALVAWGLV